MAVNIYWYTAFNNYYNRKLRYYNTLAKYPDPFYIQQNVINFTPSDGINTTQVCTESTMFDREAGQTPDYCLVVNEQGDIVSRWFVLDTQYSRNGQATVSLKRDSVADSLPSLLKSTVICYKGYVPPNNPLSYNKEPGWSCNQIKSGEMLLKDRTKCPWIVAYIAKNYSTNTPIKITHNIDYDIAISSKFEDWKYYDYTTQNKIKGRIEQYQIKTEGVSGTTVPSGTAIISVFTSTNYRQGTTTTRSYRSSRDPGNIGRINQSVAPESFNIYESIDPIIISTLQNYGLSYMGEVEYAEIQQLNGKTLRFLTDIAGTYDYRKIAIEPLANETQNYVSITTGTLYTKLKELADSIEGVSTGTQSFSGNVTTSMLQFRARNIAEASSNITITTEHYATNAGYDIIAMPYGSLTISNSSSTDSQITTNATRSWETMTQLATQLGENLYDLQLLPFCPSVNIETNMNLNGNTQLYTKATADNGLVLDYLIWCSSVDVEYSIRTSSLDNPDNIPTVISYAKRQLNTDMYRLISPNYAGQFDFNIVTNGGLQGFNVDMTMKPYNPYIHVAPIFGNLYGRDFQDARGLICGGDFSLPIITDQFKSYEINNKNYQAIFDRQTHTLEMQNTIAQASDITSAITGVVGSTVKGGATGGLAGALVGGGLSAIGGGIDIGVNNMMRHEQMNLRKDMFDLQLDNIKARPYSLAKTSALNASSKLFVTLEFYTCTQQEKFQLTRKIEFEGATINAIGKIEDFLQQTNEAGIVTYFKGDIVIFDDNFVGDYHMIADISNELQKGLRIAYGELPSSN